MLLLRFLLFVAIAIFIIYVSIAIFIVYVAIVIFIVYVAIVAEDMMTICEIINFLVSLMLR